MSEHTSDQAFAEPRLDTNPPPSQHGHALLPDTLTKGPGQLCGRLSLAGSPCAARFLGGLLVTSNLEHRSSQDGNKITAAAGWLRRHCCPLPELGDLLGPAAHTSMSGRTILCRRPQKLKSYVGGMGKGNISIRNSTEQWGSQIP